MILRRCSSSPVFSSASVSFKIPMTCSSAKLVRYIARPLQGPESDLPLRIIRGLGHIQRNFSLEVRAVAHPCRLHSHPSFRSGLERLSTNLNRRHCAKARPLAGRADIAPVLRRSSVTMPWHPALLASCTKAISTPCRRSRLIESRSSVTPYPAPRPTLLFFA